MISEMNNCTNPKWRALKIIEAMEYLDTLPVEVGKEMSSRFGDN